MKKVIRPVAEGRYVMAARRWRGRIRYHLRCIVQPSLRGGPWIWLGPACSVKVRRGGCLVRSAGMSLRNDCRFDLYGELVVGRNVSFNSNVRISAFLRIQVGDDTRVAERVSMHDANHVFEPTPVVGEPRRLYLAEPITIGSRVWISANSVVLSGSTIGDDCVVAAGSVVKGDFPAGSLIAGVPAKVIRPLTKHDRDS